MKQLRGLYAQTFFTFRTNLVATDVSMERTALNFKVKCASKSLSLQVLDFLTLHMMPSQSFKTLGTASHSRRTASSKCSLQIVTVVRNTQSHCVTKAGDRLRLKRDGTRAETIFRLSPKRTSPFKSAGWGSVQSTADSRGVRISGSNAGYTMFRGSVRVLATHSIRQFPLHFPSRASPRAITFRTHSTHRYHCALNGQGNTCLEGVTVAYSTSPTQASLCQETGVIFSVAPS